MEMGYDSSNDGEDEDDNADDIEIDININDDNDEDDIDIDVNKNDGKDAVELDEIIGNKPAVICSDMLQKLMAIIMQKEQQKQKYQLKCKLELSCYPYLFQAVHKNFYNIPLVQIPMRSYIDNLCLPP